MPHKICTSTLFIMVLLVTSISLNSCSGGNTNVAGGSSTVGPSPAASPKSGFEADLDYVRKGQFTYVWVFSRKDGKPLDKDDGDFLRTNAPQVVDWASSDHMKVVAGTNFDLAKGNLELLKKRFNAEDYTGR
jgi:hypothetical protein